MTEAEWQRAKVAEKRGYWQAVVDTGGGSFSKGAVRALDDLLEAFDQHAQLVRRA